MELVKTAGAAVIVYGTHYASIKLYDAFCVPFDMYGFIQGFISVGSPFCTTLMNIASQTQVSYSSILTLGLTRMALEVFK